MFACSNFHSACLFAVRVLQFPFRVLYFQFRVHHLQFARSNCHSVCSICSSHALFSFSRALFAVRVLYFQFRMLHLQFVYFNFDSTCSICSSHALFSLLRALFAVRVLYFQFRVVYLQFACSFCSSRALFAVRALFSIPRATFAARMLWSPFHVLQLQLARFNILAFFCSSCARRSTESARYCFCTWFFVADCACGTWIKLCVWCGFNMANFLIVIIFLLIFPNGYCVLPNYIPAICYLGHISGRDSLITTYFNLGFTYNEIVAFLLLSHGIKLGLSQLKRVLKSRRLRRRENASRITEVINAVGEELRGIVGILLAIAKYISES